MKQMIILLIKLYQIALSPFFGQQCRFSPSCSHYAIESIEQHGVKGVLFAIKRLLRCNPWCAGGHDPIPK